MKDISLFKKLPSHSKPREKAYLFGVENLTDVELLAIIIRSGSKNKDVMEVSFEIIKKFNSLEAIKNLSFNDLTSIEGIGKVKALEIKSLIEFSKRLNKKTGLKISTLHDAVAYASGFIKNWNRESFVIMVIDHHKKMVFCKTLYVSHSDGISIDPREIISLVLKTNHNNFYCFHNHPSGNTTPSEEDKLTTERLLYFTKLMGLRMISHIVITENAGFKEIIIYSDIILLRWKWKQNCR